MVTIAILIECLNTKFKCPWLPQCNALCSCTDEKIPVGVISDTEFIIQIRKHQPTLAVLTEPVVTESIPVSVQSIQ